MSEKVEKSMINALCCPRRVSRKNASQTKHFNLVEDEMLQKRVDVYANARANNIYVMSGG